METVAVPAQVNDLNISRLSIQAEINAPDDVHNTANGVDESSEKPSKSEDKTDNASGSMIQLKKPSDEHCAKWLVESDFSGTESVYSKPVSEVFDTDDASSVADSDVHSAMVDPRFALQKKYLVSESLQENGNDTFVDTSGNIFKNINVENSEKVYVGNVTNINIYKVRPDSTERKKTTASREPTVEMEEQVPDNIFLKSKVPNGSNRPLSIVPRRRWLAQQAIEFEELEQIPKYVVISHTATEPGVSIAENVSLVRDIQCFHIESRNWSDISYSFLIGEDGNVYEGRGWKRVGAHTLGYNRISIGISFIGCYMTVTPPDRSLRTLSALLEMAVKEKHITPDYSLLAHCQCSPVESPGKALFEVLKTHPHWLANPPPNDA